MQPERTKSDVKKVRHAADLIGVTVLLEYFINIILLLLFRLLPDVQNPFLTQALDIGVYLAVFFVPFFLLTRWSGWTLRDLTGDGRPGLAVFVMAVCLAAGWNFVATLLSVGVEGIVNLFGYTEPADAYTLPGSTAGMLLQILQVALIPPVVEELCFRGFYLKTAEKAMGTWSAILLSSMVFWLAHNSISILPLAFGFGILGGVLRKKYQSLFPSMCAHFIVNGTYIVVNWVQATQPFAVQNGISLLFVLTELVCLVVGLLLAHRLGLCAAMWEYMRGSWTVRQRDLLRGIFTSIPFWMVLLAAAYFISRGLEVLG